MNEWVWSNGGMILTGEKWSTGRKTLYSMGGRWMNEYGAMVEWYQQGKRKYLEKKMFPLDFVYHISHREWPRTKPGSPLWEASGWPWSLDTAPSEACVFNGVNCTRNSDISPDLFLTFNSIVLLILQIKFPLQRPKRGKAEWQGSFAVFNRVQVLRVLPLPLIQRV